jgi:hypothetical protein
MNQSTQVITLTNEEIQKAKDEGMRRRSLAVAKRRTDYCPKPSNDRVFMDINGAAGELAGAKYFGFELDFDPYKYGSADLVIGNVSIDFKTTHHQDGVLLVQQSGSSHPSVYVCVVGSIPTYQLVGWKLATEVRQPHNQSKRFYMAYAIEQQFLNPIATLPRFIVESTSCIT